MQVEEAHLDALDYYQAALAKKPGDARICNKLGIVELRMQRYKEARKYFEKAIKIERMFATAKCLAALNRQRRQAVPCPYARTHQPQGRGDAFHGPAHQ